MKKYQRQYCYRYPKMIDVIREGVNTALSKCRDRFRSERWNCTPLNWEQVLSGGGLLKKGSILLTVFKVYKSSGFMYFQGSSTQTVRKTVFLVKSFK